MIQLVPLTQELCHEIYRAYVSDPMMTLSPYTYDFDETEKYYTSRIVDTTRRYFAIMHHNQAIGEMVLKKIDLEGREGTMGLMLVNDSVKGKGYGTQAEKLLIDYAFNDLNLDVLKADTIHRNVRSQHILLKLGFQYTHEDENLKYYILKKQV